MHIQGMQERSDNATKNLFVENTARALRDKAGISKPQGVTKKRKRIALAVAALVDGVQLFPGAIPFTIEGAFSPFVDGLDAFAAIALLFILGFQWRLLLSLAAELVPGLTLFPTWTAVVLSIPVEEPILDVSDRVELKSGTPDPDPKAS